MRGRSTSLIEKILNMRGGRTKGVKRLMTSIFRIGVDRLPESVDSSFSALLIGSAEMVEKPGERRRDVS